jgi:hypothetical protein
MFLLQSYGEGIWALGGDGEVLTDPIDQGGDQHGISLGFVVEQIKFIPL